MNRSPLRVLFVQPLVPAYREPFFAGLQARDGLEIEVWSDERGAGSLRAVPTTRFRTAHRPEKTLGGFVSQPALLEASLSETYDVVIFPWNSRYLELVPAVLVARARGLRVLLWGHGYSKSEKPHTRAMRNGIGRLASGCVTYSHGAARRLIQDGFAKEKVFVAQNALDRESIDRALRDMTPSEPPGLAGSSPDETIIFVSRLEAAKSIDFLLRAFSRVVAALPRSRLVLVGDGEARPALESLACELGVAERVNFLGALYEEKEVARWMTRAGVFAYPSNIGLSLLHAFHYGLPVVTSANADAHNPEFEVLVPGENGLVYPDGDEAAFADRIVSLLDNPMLRARLGKAALATVVDPGGATMSRMIDGMEDAILGRARSTR